MVEEQEQQTVARACHPTEVAFEAIVRIQTLEDALLKVTASLAGAISLLEQPRTCTPPPMTIMHVMLQDYRRSLAYARAILASRIQV